MAKKHAPKEVPNGRAVRQATALNEILEALQSPCDGTRAEAVRTLCPCRTQWDVPVQRYVAAMRDDPSPSVRHEVHHVLDEDSGWGKRLAHRKLHEAPATDDDGVPGPHSIAWRKRGKPKTPGRFGPPRFRASAGRTWKPRSGHR
jgi:hypothetical protein